MELSRQRFSITSCYLTSGILPLALVDAVRISLARVTDYISQSTEKSLLFYS